MTSQNSVLGLGDAVTDDKTPFKSHDAEIPMAISEEKFNGDRLRWNKTTAGFFLLGVLASLPAAVTTTASNETFSGLTGLYEVVASASAAIISFGGPFLIRYVSYDQCTILCTVASLLSYIICTLPHPLGDGKENLAGPVIGTILAGFVYAFGTNVYLSVAAFFPAEAVLGLSVGSGFGIILGPLLYIGLEAAYKQSWRRTFLTLLSTVVIIPIVWWGLVDKTRRTAAERSRRESGSGRAVAENTQPLGDEAFAESSIGTTDEWSLQAHQAGNLKPGFGPKRSRLQLVFKRLVPKYVVPLFLCTSSATISSLGTSPSLQTLDRLRNKPEGDIQFQLGFLAYGTAQFLFSTFSSVYHIPLIWIWTGAEISLLAIGLVQLFYPFLTYYGVWIVVMFLVGGCVGGGVTNTNYKIARDFQRAGEPDEVRSFAMSFAGLGNFGGDAIGGALAILVQQLSTTRLVPGPRG
ncbi:hypothetical protein F5B22DRAFT_640627 [Xylaria bambusicola]|uniref:uncharacterized protein n=1 Tax=Xylaria bambusicola TaxID=326684 RepID=UPI002007D1B0|nr:uncharacterized protein F5B22DRAFT_640627 [Xylaria bambusicola]KAI0502803.1 hypothetical protein F5B22DRAFT_640627 [Xylaria bambusicola]